MNILWIDWWAKYIWLAKKNIDTWFITPLWYLDNDWGTMFNLADIIIREKIKKICIWWPTKEKIIQEKINKFINEFKFIDPNIEFIKIDEDYTSVEAAAITWEFKKERWKEDTVAAMKILERFKK